MAKTVLIVDDSATIRNLLKCILANTGYQIDEAENGKVALELACKAHYDLILTDQNMPEMEGIELIRSLRQIVRHQYTPILILTTEDSEEFKQRARDAGATGWLNKPFEPQALTDIVAALLEPDSA